MVAIYQADVFHFSARFDVLRRPFYRQVFDNDHRIAILQNSAVTVFHHKRIGGGSNLRRRAPLVATFGTGQQAVHFIRKGRFAQGAGS